MQRIRQHLTGMRSLSYAEYRQTHRFPALDGLRAVTVLSLIGLHWGTPRIETIMGQGKITVFFVLSGFLITLLLLRDEERHGRVRLRHFFVRRQFRLLPIYYTVLFLTVIFQYHNYPNWEYIRQSFPYHLIFMQELNDGHANATTFVHAWTMGYEQKFYLVWPLLFVLVSRLAPHRRLPVVLGVTLAIAATIPFAPYQAHYFALALGSLLGLVCNSERGWRIVRPLTHPLVALVVAAGFIVLHYQIPVWGETIHVHRAFAFYALGTALLIVSILNTGIARWLLTRRFLLFVGERSYGIYLIHGLAGAAVVNMAPQLQDQLGGWPVVIAACAVAIAIADVLQRWVELPIAAQGRRFNAWLDRRAVDRAARPDAVPEPSQIPSAAVAEPDSQPVRP